MTNARAGLEKVERVAAVILAFFAGSSALAQTSPMPPHGPSGSSAIPNMPPASALDGSPVSQQNFVNGHLPPSVPGGQGPTLTANAPYQAPAAVSAATRARTPGAAAASSFTATDWPTFGMDMQRTGNNPVETVLSPTTVRKGLVTHWATDLGGAILTQPTVAAGVNINGTLTDVVYAATLLGTTFALDASTGAIIWQQSVPPVQTSCEDLALSGGNAGFIGTPTIDRSTNRLYIVSGRGYLHAYDLATGRDTPGFNLPIPDAANFWPRTFVYGSPAIIGTSLYVATAGNPCDIRPYHGQVVHVSTSNPPTILERWYPTGANGPEGGGIWGAGGVSIPPDGTVVYALTGNAFANPQNAGFAEHVVKLTPTLAAAASNSPLAPTAAVPDMDFGATAVLFQRPGCPTMLAAYQKSGNLFIYNRATIQQSGPIQTLAIAKSSSAGVNIGQPAFDPVLNQLYIVAPSDSPVGFNNHGLLALAVGSNCSISVAWQQPVGANATTNNPAISPIVANGVVYYADGVASQVLALDATTGNILWSTDSLAPADRITGGIFASPTVVNGQLFVAGGSDHKIHAFGL
jgi:outer membrane protein assembly factor BamB